MRFLVWGHKGWIGQAFMKLLKDSGFEAVGAESRADDVAAVEHELHVVQPDRVVSFIGRTRGGRHLTIDYLEQPDKLMENMRDNLWSPVVLAQVCARHSIHFTYLGTGCIFYYDEAAHRLGGDGFDEAATPNFFGSAYSTVKGYTDRLMHLLFNATALNARIRMPISADNSPYNFITKIANYEKVVNIPNSMTVLPEMLPILVQLSLDKVTGTINLTNPGAISHNEVLELYKRHVDPAYTYENFSVDEQNKILLSARSNNLLDTRWLQHLFPHVNDIHTAVEKVCIEIANKFPRGIVERRMKARNSYD
ncbi:putative dTDP-4-dehydrorhamnose reductase domain protein [Trypanosoma rangeli]|uniref:Putative dTDP-4-dehydrorhamnose reductase domain protein n=1 Tax=Trypanosoma rangeli TaxID=5698 RepID=A0A422P3Q4_TRYRA|nr:putative dTDP-4-dehydrorhamnose reductase domain protein [Trypanosoma rangeli]RNF12339.1 putative dTDP-4-dehydrorhamnose reductase domain protein [Trypanosoma rangeli]|eukprot:RNF12339.1 putative dTDP-4-dehydrorhamnose reductase domain protein [Trypanosoma rangeli]